MESRRCRANNMNGGMNTAIIEEEKHRLVQTNNSRQDLYTTAFVTPLKTFKQNGLPWPFTTIFDGLQEAKWFRSKNETGFAVSAVCIAAIIFGSLTERTLLGLLLIFQTIAVKLIPYSLVISLLFWTGAFMRKIKWTISWRFTLSMSLTAELLAELSSKYFTVSFANLIGLAISSVFSLTLGILKQDFASSTLIFILAAIRFVVFGAFLQQHSADLQTLFTYFACFFGFCLGYVLNSSNSDNHDSPSDANDAFLGNKIPVIRKRRGSSVDSSVSGVSSFSAAAASRRRTSMPLLGLPNRRVSLTSVDLTTLGEAHGMIADLLADSSLPQSVTGALRIISDMLSPLLQQSFNRNAFSTSLVTVLEKTQVHVDEASVKDQPDLKDDTPLSLKNRLTRQLGVGVRRMSSSYTTTTSATGMPSLDIDYRRNSNSQDDRRSRTPSPKANRAKSYAGIYKRPEIRREFVKSRSFCQPSPPDVRKSSLLKEQGEETSRDSIFKTELSCSDSNFLDDHWNDNNTDDEIFETIKPENTVDDNFTEAEKPLEEDCLAEKCNNERLSSVSEATDRKESDTSCVKPGLKPDSVGPSDPKRSPSLTRKVENLAVSQNAPVRKNSRDESALRVFCGDGHGSRRGSTVSMESFTQGEYQQELATASSQEITEKMEGILSWEFPIFELSEKCHILTQTAYRVFQNRGFFQKFRIPQEVFFRYFRLLENGYHDIPYHNQIHAADVLQGTYYFTNRRIAGLTMPMDCNSRRNSTENDKVMRIPDPHENEDMYGCLADLIPDLELMALYTASAMHDFDHPGRTNAFLVATLNPKALLYNDRSVLENHHAAAAWALLLSDPTNNFLCGLESFDLKRFRFIVVEEILSTDLKKHFDFLTEWNAKISEQGGGINWSNEADRLLVGQMCIKLSDISGPSKTWDLHYKWTQRIVEEFYLQGDAEAAQGMQISPYMDRNQPRLPQLQDSFIKHLVGPLYNSYGRAGLLPGEWVENEIDPDDENDDEENYDGSSQSFTNDSTSDRSEDEGDMRSVSDKIDKAIEMKKRKVIFCETTNNINRNIERWQQIISAEATAKESEDKAACDEGEKKEITDKNEGGRQETIEEEEESENVSGCSKE